MLNNGGLLKNPYSVWKTTVLLLWTPFFGTLFDTLLIYEETNVVLCSRSVITFLFLLEMERNRIKRYVLDFPPLHLLLLKMLIMQTRTSSHLLIVSVLLYSNFHLFYIIPSTYELSTRADSLELDNEACGNLNSMITPCCGELRDLKGGHYHKIVEITEHAGTCLLTDYTVYNHHKLILSIFCQLS